MAIASLAMVDDYRMATALQYQQAGRLAEAEGIYRAILADRPGDGRAWHYLGMVDHQRGRHEDAVHALNRALALQPADSELLAHLALVEHARGAAERALELLREAIRLDPRNGEALTNLGVFAAARALGEEAIGAFARAAALDPASAECELRLAFACRQFNRNTEAMAAAARALEKDPNNARALDALALTQRDAGQLEEAIALHRRAVAIEPRFAGGWNNLGNTLSKTADRAGTVAALQRATAIDPGFAQAWLNLARAFLGEGKLAAAREACHRGLALAPRDVDGICLAGDVARAAGDFPLALAICEKAVAAGLDDQGALLGRLIEMHLAVGRWQDLARLQQAAIDLVRAGAGRRIPAFLFMRLCADPADQRRAAEAFSAGQRRSMAAFGRPFIHHPQPRPRLRLGYLSADFREHAVAQLFAEVPELHDRRHVEVRGYFTGVADDSALHKRMVKAFDAFSDIRLAPGPAAARQIKDDGIDILIDLMGHTDGARPDILVQRPAPIQVCYLGYAGTTGATFIDYQIADPVALPAEAEPAFSEAIARLPRCFLPADRHLAIAAQSPSRSEEGLPDQAIVFCCFNNWYKLGPDDFTSWLKLLSGTPGSVLWLRKHNPHLCQGLRDMAAAAGVDPGRLVFAEQCEHPRHLARHRLADLFLDTAPYGAHSTAFDALRLGVPVITMPGSAFASRVGASLLHHLGLPELIARSRTEYEAIALNLAQDPAALASLKARLAALLPASSLLQTPSFVADLERLYRRMWQAWQAGQPPASFTLEAQQT